MAVKSTDQVTIVDITDSYSVNLGNDAVTILGDTAGHPTASQTVDIPIYAFRGSEMIAPTITAADIDVPTGVTAAVVTTSPYSSTNPCVRLTIATTFTDQGEVIIPVVVDSATINKTFSISVAKAGSAGAAGRGISSTEVNYAKNESATTAPTTGWQGTPPTTVSGEYLWTRTVLVYTDSTRSNPSYSVAAHGTDGADGDDGRGIASTTVGYQKSTSGTTPPTGTWSTSPVETVAGEFLWTKTTVTYTSGDPSISYSVSAHGAKGDKGDDGTPGEDALLISITSNNGTVFKNSSGSTTLTAHVYRGGVELNSTEIAALGTLKWYKDTGTTAVGTGATLTVQASTVTNRAVYTVKLEG